MIRFVLPLLLFVVLVGCAVIGNQQEKYELVRIGMTAQQVERRFGPIEWRHLTYDRIEKGGSAHHLEFEDGKLGNSYQVVEKGRDAEPEATKRGMAIAEVIAIMGPPATNCAMFPFDDAKNWTNAGFKICFSDGRVSSKSVVEIPRLPHHPPGPNCNYSVFFDMGSAALSDATRKTLSIFSETCAPPKNSTTLIIAVTGHADVTGEEQANISIAEAVKRFLVSLHIAAPSIVVKAVGAKQPFATGPQPSLNDKEGVVTMHAMNRRVSLERRLK